MLKKILVLIAALYLFSVPILAQMSDDAVIEYVKDGMAQGKSQTKIAEELLARGVTKQQTERIRNLYNQQQSMTHTIRTEGAQERKRRMSDGVFETEIGGISQVSDNMAPSDIMVYGRDIFTNANLTFASSENMPTPVNYILGPGDEVVIDIWGTNQTTIRQTISPDGYINIPHVGVITLNGMTIKEADAYMKRKLGQIYSLEGDDPRSEIMLTLGNIRTIQVNMMGEIANPGTYYISSLSNIYHALHKAGGVTALGSMRNVELIRQGKRIESLDIYDFIRNGQMSESILEEGDVINIPAYNALVSISGKIKRPMSYELKSGETIQDLLEYASGFTSDAYTKNLQVVRRNGAEYQIFTVDKSDYATFELLDGDNITVGAMLDRYENRIEIKGAVYRPGIYELGRDISTVRELITKSEGLKGDAFTNRALLTREREDLTLEIIPIDLNAIMTGANPDIILVRNDVLYIPSIHDLNDLGNVSVGGEVAKPGTFVYADNMTIEDAIMLAGGLLESASVVKIDVSRRIKDRESEVQTERIADVFTFSFKDGYIVDGQSSFVLEPYDHVYVRRSPSYSPQHTVVVEGEVTFPGEYTITNRNERISDLVKKAGGVNQWAFLSGARLSRKMTVDEQRRSNTSLNVIKSAKDSIDAKQLYMEERYYVGIDLTTALENPGSDVDIILKEGDKLIIPQFDNTVRISGNVLYPNSVTYSPNMSIKDYVEQAGGFGFRSKKNRVYIVYMNGTVAKANKNKRHLVKPGSEIVVPMKRDRDGALQEALSIATTASSLATMIATIGNILQ